MSNSFISSTSKGRRQREKLLPSQNPLQTFKNERKDSETNMIPQLEANIQLQKSLEQNNLQESQSQAQKNQMNFSMGQNSYFNETNQVTPMGSKKITFNEVTDLPLKNSQNMKSLVTSNMQESLLKENMQYSQGFQKHNITSNKLATNQNMPEVNVIAQSNSPQNQLVEENYSLKTKLQTTLFKNEQLEMENQDLQNRLQQIQLQNKNLMQSLEQGKPNQKHEQRLNYYVEILENKNQKIQELNNEIKQLEQKLLQISQKQNINDLNFQSQKFKSLMNKFDPLVQSNIKQNGQTEIKQQEKMIVKIDKPKYQRHQSQSYEQTPKRDYKVYHQKKEKIMTNQEQNEVRTLYSKNSHDESFRRSIPRHYNNTSTTYYQVPAVKYDQQPTNEYGTYRYSTKRGNRYEDQHNNKKYYDTNNYTSSRQLQILRTQSYQESQSFQFSCKLMY